jgi:rhodanese-related sulfurtransferase
MSDADLPTIDVREAARRLEVRGDGPEPLLLDVREVDEYTARRVDGAVLLPISRLALGYRALPRDRPILVLCKVGGRSAMATDFLRRQGWPDVTNIAGGITAWSQAGLPTRSGPVSAGEGELAAD